MKENFSNPCTLSVANLPLNNIVYCGNQTAAKRSLKITPTDASGATLGSMEYKKMADITPLVPESFKIMDSTGASFVSDKMDFTKETADPDSYLKKSENDLKRDLQRGFTTFGPHLDDFEFMFDGKPMRSFGSRGQCRMTSLILKLAELDAVREVSGALNDTVVLVDDATADLDLHARQAFLEKIRTAGQVFFAFTEIPPEFRLEKCNRFQVKAGEVTRLN